MNISYCLFFNNSANLFGSLYIQNSGDIFITNCFFLFNHAVKGGAIYYDEKDECKYFINFLII